MPLALMPHDAQGLQGGASSKRTKRRGLAGQHEKADTQGVSAQMKGSRCLEEQLFLDLLLEQFAGGIAWQFFLLNGNH